MLFDEEVDVVLDIFVRRKGKRYFFIRLLAVLLIAALLFFGYRYLIEEGGIFYFSDPVVISFDIDGQKIFVKFQEEHAACAQLGIAKYQFINVNNISFVTKGLKNIRVLKKTSEQPQNCQWLSALEGFRLTPEEMRKYAP